MACPEAEALAQLAGPDGDPGARAAVADHAASCASCHAILMTLVSGAEPGRASEPERVGRYVIKHRLGAGGMGVVYEASDPELGRNVAIKMLRRGAPAERLRREAQALARLAHPNVVAVHDVGEHDGQVFVAMTLVDGDNLRQWLARGSHPTREILNVLVHAGRGVAAAHQAGLVHRDLKPDNVFVSRAGEVLVGDFGLARDASDDDPLSDEQLGAAATNLTMTGVVLGTPAYMPPEQADGAATAASDQFSFCITAFEALHGVRPFAGDTFDDLQANIRAARLVAPQRPTPLPARVTRALRRGLSVEPADRFPTMNALLAALEPRASWIRRVVPLALAAVVASAILAAVLVVRGSHGVACSATGEELASTWSGPRREAVLLALQAHEVTPQAASELTGELDRYATSWIATREEACVAEGERRLSSEQLATQRTCLDTRAAELGAVIHDVETAPDPDPLALWQRVGTLVPPEACRDDATARLAVGGGDHAVLMQAISAVDVHNDASVLATLHTRAEAARDQPALLALELKQGRFLIDNGSRAQADAPLQHALALAEQLGVTSSRVEALALLARSACTQGKFDASTPLLVMADADAAHDTQNGVEADVVLRARAECMYQRRAPEAVPMLRELIAHSIARYGADSPHELDLRVQLGEIYYALGQLDDGKREVAVFARIWARFERPGESAAPPEEQIADTAFRNGDLALATEHQRRAVELWGGDHPEERAAALATLALMYELGAAPKVAAATYAEVVKLVPRGAANASIRVESLVQSGVAMLQLGDLDAAAAAFDQAGLEARELGSASFENDAEIGRGRVAVERGDFARGARILQAALPTYTTRVDASAFRSGVAQFALARALWETGDTSGAASVAAQAETNLAQGVADTKSNPLGTKLVASREVLLDQVTRWRDERRSGTRHR